MTSGPGGINRNRPRTRIGHLTVVPKDESRTIKVSEAIRRVTDRIEPPWGFRIFHSVEFTTCKRLAKPENGDLLKSAIDEFKKRIGRDPNYLAPTSENFRVMGAEAVIFMFKHSGRGVALAVRGISESTAFVEIEEILLNPTRRR